MNIPLLVAKSTGASARTWLVGLTSLFTRQKLEDIHRVSQPGGLLSLKEVVEAGKAKPVIERRYSLSEVPDALRHVVGGHAREQVVVRIADQTSSLTPSFGSGAP